MKRKKLKYLLYVFFVIYYIIFLFNSGTLNLNMFNLKQKRLEREEAKHIAIEYLNKQYNKDFNLKFSSKGFKSKENSFIGNYYEFGHDKNIREYVFRYSVDDIPGTFYVTVWKNLINNSFEIKEVNGKKSNIDDTSYGKKRKLYDDKEGIKDELDKIVSSNYNDYNIDYDSNENKVIIAFNHSFADEMNNNFKNMSSIIKLLKDKEISIEISFLDTTRYYYQNTKIEEEKNKCSFLNQIKKYMNQNYKLDYTVILENNFFVQVYITIPVKIIDSYYYGDREMYTQLCDGLLELTNENEEKIALIFDDKTIEIGYGKYSDLKGQYDSLEKCIENGAKATRK